MYRKAVAQLASHPDLWGNLADALRLAGDKPRATEAYRRAIEMTNKDLQVNSKDGDQRASLATYYAGVGEPENALREISTALSINAGLPSIQFKACVVYELSGQRELALRALESAMTNGYSKPEIRRHPDLAGLRSDSRYTILLRSLNNPDKTGNLK
jgi:serine/threonine-protein kinase